MVSLGKRSFAPTTAASGWRDRVGDEVGQPAGGRDGVVVQQDENSFLAAAAPALQAPANPRAVSLRTTRMRAPYSASIYRVAWLRRPVVDDDDLAVDAVVGFGQQGVEALARDRGLVVDRDDDRDGEWAGVVRRRLAGGHRRGSSRSGRRRSRPRASGRCGPCRSSATCRGRSTGTDRAGRASHSDQSRSSATGETPASLPGLYSPEQKYSMTVSRGKVLPWANPGGSQIHSAVVLVALDRHVVGDDFAVGRRALRMSSATSIMWPRIVRTSLPM